LIVLSEKHLCFIDLISIRYDDNVDLPEKVDNQHYVSLMHMFCLLKPMQNDTEFFYHSNDHQRFHYNDSVIVLLRE
jgi:hypothetical protein